MFVEMRTYRVKPGKRAEFLEIFQTKSIPAHAAIGMEILGPFLSVEDPDVFFFMRGFPDLESREPMKAKFYESELWKSELEHVLMPMLEKYDVVLVDDPDERIFRSRRVEELIRRGHSLDNGRHDFGDDDGDDPPCDPGSEHCEWNCNDEPEGKFRESER